MKKRFLILVLFILTLFTTGCFDYTELNELGIISALGIEKEKNGNYLISAQIVNIKKTGAESGNEGISKVVTYTGKGKTIEQAIKNISNLSSKEVFLAHLKLVIIDDDVIKNGTSNIVDFFVRNTKIKSNFAISTSSKDSPLEILKTLTPLDSLPSEDIYNMIESSEKLVGNATILTFDDFLNDLLQYGINPVYTNLEISGEKKGNEDTESLKKSTPNSIVEINNLIAYDKNGKVTKLNKEESIGYSFIKNKVKTPVITAKCENEKNYFSVNILGSKNNIKFSEKNNTVTFELKATGNISEANCKKNYTTNQLNTMINKQTKKQISKYIKSSFELAQKNQNDFLGIGNYIYKNNKNYFDFKNKNWDKVGLNKLKLKIKINLKITKEGNTEESVFERNKNE